MSAGPSVLAEDYAHIDSTGIFLREDYERSTMWSGDLWDGIAPFHGGELAYKLSRGSLDGLTPYDIYPGKMAVPIVSDRLRELVETVCSEAEIGFYPCAIVTKSKQRALAWAMYPRLCAWCIDRERSDIDWFVPDLKPDEVSIKRAKRIEFTRDCMPGLNIIRLREKRDLVLVSPFLRSAIGSFNGRGVSFLSASELPNWLGS